MRVLQHQILRLGPVLWLKILRIELLPITVTAARLVVELEKGLRHSSLGTFMCSNHQFLFWLGSIIVRLSVVPLQAFGPFVLDGLHLAASVILDSLVIHFLVGLLCQLGLVEDDSFLRSCHAFLPDDVQHSAKSLSYNELTVNSK